MSTIQIMSTILVVVLGTMLTRFLPFLLFPGGKEAPRYIQFLGKYLPSAVFGLLVVYCLKDVSFRSPAAWLPEALALAVTLGLHGWKKNLLLSIALGTAAYMLLLRAGL